LKCTQKVEYQNVILTETAKILCLVGIIVFCLSTVVFGQQKKVRNNLF